ncbi:MAG TPA: hypothetical protein VIO38_12545, partial [Rariglobus sp.]
DFIAACEDEGDEVRRAEAETAFLARFRDDAQGLLKLGEEAARTGRVETARRVEARCRESGRAEVDAGLVLMTALLVHGEPAGALALGEALAPRVAGTGERLQLILGGLRAVALYGLGRDAEAEPLVRRVCETRLLPGAVLVALAERLEGVRQHAQAQRVLRHAVEVDPLNQPSLVSWMRGLVADGQTEEALAQVDRLLAMRKPPADLLAELGRRLDSDLYLFLPGRERGRVAIAGWLRPRGLIER